MKVRYTLPALAELDMILDHIRQHSPQGARRVQERIQRIVDVLSAHPNVGVRTDDTFIRRLSAAPYPYLLFYEITETDIVIHSVRHAARDRSEIPRSE